MKFYFLSFLFFVNVLLLNAQTSLTTSDILASAKKEYVLKLQKKRVDFLQKNNPKLPLVDEVEFRTETNDFELSEQRYTIRGRFHTRAQQQAQRNFQQTQIEITSIEEQILINELLRERYNGILEALYFDKLLGAKREEKILIEDRLTVLKKSINLPKFDILDLIDAEENLHETERDILRLENSIVNTEGRISRWTNETGTFDVDNVQLIDIDQIMELVRSFPSEPSTAHAALMKRNLNVDLAMREQAVRKAREDNTFEYFQTKIGGTDDTGFKQVFSLGLGIRVPVRNREAADLNELEFEKIDELAKYEELQLELQTRISQLRTAMENQYRLYELLKTQMANSQADEVFKQYQKIAGTSPLALLQLKGNRFKKELEQFSIEQDIYLLYIELLDASGKMMELPLRNYLHSDLTILP